MLNEIAVRERFPLLFLTFMTILAWILKKTKSKIKIKC